jgi:diguanylate cyclase (GGDEF)-like protein
MTEQESDSEELEFDRATLVEILDRPSLAEPKSHVRDRVLLTLLTGPERGAVFKMESDNITLGRSGEADITIVDLGLSRVHARLVRRGSSFYLADQGSTNGTFVHEQRLEGPVEVGPGTRFRLGLRTVVALSLHDELEESAALSVHEAALRDRLTGVYNRGVFDDRLLSEMAFARRHKTSLSVLLFDVDHFKGFNDTHGHLVGDAVLVAVGKSLQDTVRTEDVVARYGGEEFVVIARSTDSERAKILGERIRRAVEKTVVPAGGKNLSVTASIGVSTLVESGDYASPKALVEAADRALYAAKRSGRNRVLHVDGLP